MSEGVNFLSSRILNVFEDLVGYAYRASDTEQSASFFVVVSFGIF